VRSTLGSGSDSSDSLGGPLVFTDRGGGETTLSAGLSRVCGGTQVKNIGREKSIIDGRIETSFGRGNLTLTFFCKWKDLRPHLLHKVCDLEWAFPKEGVPYELQAGRRRRRVERLSEE